MISMTIKKRLKNEEETTPKSYLLRFKGLKETS